MYLLIYLPTPSPIKSIYDYLKSHPNEKIYFVGGVRDEEDAIDLKKRTQSAINKYPNVEVLAIPGSPAVSGTKARNALLNNNKELFFTYLPDEADKEQVWTLITQQ
jgi:hypothetical protein